MKKLFVLTSLVAVTAMALSACAGGQAAASDLLGQIKQRGYIVVSTDPNYEPQSFLINPPGQRPAGTKCPSDLLTTAEMQGFDVDTAAEIAKRLGVEVCFATPDWDMITAGSWADKWDISVGSMTITVARAKVLAFTTAYYYAPAAVAAVTDSGITKIEDLAGKGVCAGAATTYEAWAGNDYSNPNAVPEASVYVKAPAGVTVVALSTDQDCIQAIQDRKDDFVAVATSKTVIDSAIANGLPLTQLGGPIYSEELAVAIDKSHTLPIDSLVKAVDDIVKAMHSDGTLSGYSTKWFKADLTQAPNQ